MLVWWASLSIVDRRTRRTKALAVAVIEKAIIDETVARTNAVVRARTLIEGEEEEDADEETGAAPAKKGN